jgi:hypothetical protein
MPLDIQNAIVYCIVVLVGFLFLRPTILAIGKILFTKKQNLKQEPKLSSFADSCSNCNLHS